MCSFLIALTEARDIDMHLKGIAKHFQSLEEIDFSEIVPLFKPMFHILCLIWGESKYYCQSSKLMVVLRELCNLLIHQVCFFMIHNDTEMTMTMR